MASVDIFDDSARIEVQLPWYFAPLQKKSSMCWPSGAKAR
jgi:hypothetical protein